MKKLRNTLLQCEKNSDDLPSNLTQRDLIKRVSELETALNIGELENKTLLDENLELTDKLNEILISKAWKLVSFLRLVKWRIAPPHSFLNRIGKLVVKFSTHTYQVFSEISNNRKIRKFEDTLKSILERNMDRKDIIIFAPSVNWNISLFQRPQHLATQFAKNKVLTFFIEPENSLSKAGFIKIRDYLYVCKVPVETFRIIKNPAVVFLSYNLRYIKDFSSPRIIYEFIDELTVFPGNISQLRLDHKEFLRKAQIVVATANRLHHQVAKIRPDALLVQNGVDYDHFHKVITEPFPVPTDLIPYKSKGNPIIGYYGALARWFDYELLKKLAVLRPELTFVLIGPEYDRSLASSGIESVPNIHWLGIKDYKILPKYLSCFDVAIIPFKVISITHSTSPLKLYEFMAGNKPVVVTPMSESMRIEGVLVAGSANEFSTKINEALELRRNPEYIALIDKIAQENTWSHRCDQILAQLAKSPAGFSSDSSQPEL